MHMAIDIRTGIDALDFIQIMFDFTKKNCVKPDRFVCGDLVYSVVT